MRTSKLFLILAVLMITSWFFPISYSAKAAAVSRDAIAIRVMPNPDHFSPLVWYGRKVELKGSPQNLLVDGYEAVRDGRTVYVNAANISGNNFYTNIYIISYNQAAENKTIDIFGQILAHWKFNTNSEINDNQKQKITRDVKRLANLSELNQALANYKNSHNGQAPALTSGSYLVGRSISKWPSWQASLGADLGLTMPLDPVNKLGGCPAGFNKETCWNETDKIFYFNFNLTATDIKSISHSPVYWYQDGVFYAGLETGYDIIATVPKISFNVAL